MPRPHYYADFSCRSAPRHDRSCLHFSESEDYSSAFSFESASSGSGEEYDPGSADHSLSSSSSSSEDEPVFVTKVYKRRKARGRAPTAETRHRRNTAKPKRASRKRSAKPRRGGKRFGRRISLARSPSPSPPSEVAAAADAPAPPPAPAQVQTSGATSGVYALQTLSGDAPTFYVGKSSNIAKRLQDHRAGMGVQYLAGVDFAEVPLITEGSTLDLESWERNETLRRMLEFGVDNVRGWMFSSRHLQPDDHRAAFHQICEKFDLCRRCGRNSHFVSDCFAKSTAPWANGLPLGA